MSIKKQGKLGEHLAIFENLSNKPAIKPKQTVKAKKHSKSAMWEDRFKTAEPELVSGPPKTTKAWEPTNDAIKTDATIRPKPGRIEHTFNEYKTAPESTNRPKKVIKDWQPNHVVNNPSTAHKICSTAEQKEEKKEDETNLLINGYIREIEQILNNQIIPISINTICWTYYYILPLVFDEAFNKNGYFILSEDKKIATWAKIGGPGAHDYKYYPAVRVSNPIDPSDKYTQIIRFKLSQYGWFGIGSDTMKPDGFPGYTDSGWMIRISNGGSWYNDVANALGCHNTGNLTNQMVTMQYNPNSKQVIVINQTGQQYVYTHNDMPTEKAYFVFTMAKGKVQIFDTDQDELEQNKTNKVVQTNMNMPFVFDVYEPDRFSITQDGTMAKGCGSGCCYSVVTTTTAFNKGVHEWKIKFMEVEHRHTNPGIITDITNLSSISRSWYNLKNNQGSKLCGLLYIWHDFDGKLQEWNDGVLTVDQGNLSAIILNDVIKIVLDCDNWTISFYRNDVLAGTMNLIPNKLYHPCLYTCDCHRQKYELIR